MKSDHYFNLLRFVFGERMQSEDVEDEDIKSLMKSLSSVEDCKLSLLAYELTSSVGTTKLDYKKGEETLLAFNANSVEAISLLHLISDLFMRSKKRTSDPASALIQVAKHLSRLDKHDLSDALVFFKQFRPKTSDRLENLADKLYLSEDEKNSLRALPLDEQNLAFKRLERISTRSEREEVVEGEFIDEEQEQIGYQFHDEKTRRKKVIQKQRDKALSSKNFSKKSEAIRRLLRQKPHIKPAEILDSLKSEGVIVTRDLVKRVRANWKKRRGKKGTTDLIDDFLTFPDEYPSFYRELLGLITEFAWSEPAIRLFVGQWAELVVIRKHFSADLLKHYSQFRTLLEEGNQDGIHSKRLENELTTLRRRVEELLSHEESLQFFFDPRFHGILTPHLRIKDQRYEAFKSNVLQRLGISKGNWFHELQRLLLRAIGSTSEIEIFKKLQQQVLIDFDSIFQAGIPKTKARESKKKRLRIDEIEDFERRVLKLKL